MGCGSGEFLQAFDQAGMLRSGSPPCPCVKEDGPCVTIQTIHGNAPTTAVAAASHKCRRTVGRFQTIQTIIPIATVTS